MQELAVVLLTGTLSLGSYSTAFGSNIVSSSNFTSNSSSYLAFGTTLVQQAGHNQQNVCA